MFLLWGALEGWECGCEFVSGDGRKRKADGEEVKERERRTRSRMKRTHALQRSLMNSVSSSLSVYHGPPVISSEGCKW